jgi:hypothetical protein
MSPAAKRAIIPATVEVLIVRGVGGLAVYINGRRIAGEKPWAEGKAEARWPAVSAADIREALKGARE